MIPVRAIIDIGFILYFLNENKEITNKMIAVILELIALTSCDGDPQKAIKRIVDAEAAISPIEGYSNR